jgi:CDP-diglyceride synthetase
LIALSPKKTWEGYIGGAISTFLFSLIVILKNILAFIILAINPGLDMQSD